MAHRAYYSWLEEEYWIGVIEDSFISKKVIVLRCQLYFFQSCLQCLFQFTFFMRQFFAKYFSDTHLVKAFFKGCGKQRNMLLFFNEFRRRVGSWFFENLGIVVREIFLWFEIFQFLKVFVKPLIVVFLYYLYRWSIDRITSSQEDESVVESVDGVMFSLDVDCVFIEGCMMRNKVDGLV